MVCADCGTRNSPQAQFCGNCGAPLSARCAACGVTVARSSRFCESCGADLHFGRLYETSGNRETIAAPVNPPQHLAKRLIESRAAIEGERKLITVLFADMKGSTSLIQDLDPEQVEERLRPTLQIMIDAVHRYEGTVNRIEGDGIMALFGAPLAYEDSAVRAAYAALDMQNALRAASDTQPAIRVGLHAGEVLVRAVNTDLSVDYDAIGATVHLAARMEQMAAPGSIYCTADVVRLAEGLIEARSLGLVPVKGFREPLNLFEVTGHTSARTRWEVAAARGLTQFVSRDAEISVLRETMRGASEGNGKLVGVVGEPGAGKSRLVHEMLHLPEASAWTVLRATTASYTRNTPYFAFSNLIRVWCEIPERAISDEVDRRIRAKISALGENLALALPAIQSLLDIPVKDAEWQSLEPTARRQRILAAAKTLILRAATVRPLLLWFEDMQWTDAETRALLDEIANEIDTVPLLIILTYRPEYEHKWAGKKYYREIQIEALAQAAADQLVRSILGNDEANGQFRELIVQRTDGIPLFIEETIRSLVEGGVLRGRIGDYRLSRELCDIRIPESVQAVLASRIDRLTPAQRNLLQVASVVGTDVHVTLLERIASIDGHELRTLLAGLQSSDFLYQSPNTTSFQFRFKHALTHEVAYGSLLSKTRRNLHGRIVRAIESQYRDNLAEMAESLAHHALAGELWEEALTYARQAGGKALELSAYREARIFFEQALLALTHLPQDRTHIQTGIDVRLGLRMIFGATTEYAALETYLREAEALAISIDDHPRLAAIKVAQTFVHNWQGDLETSIRCGERGLEIAREIRDSRLELSASSFLGQAYMWGGNFRQSLALLQDNRSWTTGPLRLERIGTTGTSSVLWLGMLAASQAYIGDFPDAETTAQQACAIADEVGRPYDMALAHWYAGFVQAHQGNLPRALSLLEHGYHICRSARISFLIPVISTSLGHTYALTGRFDEGIELLTKAVEYSKSAKFPYGVAWSTVYLGFANLMAGRTQHVAEQAEDAVDLASGHHYRAVEASARRLMGDACRCSDRHETAEAYYLEALQIASELGLRPEVAHCQNGLAQACFLLGRSDDSNRFRSAATALYSSLKMPAALTDSQIADDSSACRAP
jgi:class 3 adenylate cyclase/tetratricopeptide (TPR) repeat protein